MALTVDTLNSPPPDLADHVVEFIRTRDWVTFVELSNHFGSITDVSGHTVIALGTHQNIIFWFDMAESWAQLIIRLAEAKRIFYHPSSVMVHLIDGGIPNVPVAKGLRHYKTPHWAPVCLRTVPTFTLPQEEGSNVS